MDSADLNRKVPTNFQDEIIKYLQQQEHLSGYGECSVDEKVSKIREEHELLVEDVTNLINSLVDRIVQHEARMKAHNQYPLFDLSKIIPGFYIDDDLYKKLEFRESVIISVLDKTKDGLLPKPVGGMCLDIQHATGKNPLERRIPNFHDNKPDAGVIASEIIQKSRNQEGYFENNDGLSPTLSEPSTTHLVNKLKAEFEISYVKFLVHVSTQFDMRGHNSGSRITAWVDRNFHTLEEKRTEFTIEDNGALNEKTLYCALQHARYFIKTSSTIAENEECKLYYSLKKCKNLICEGSNFLLMRYLAIQRYIGIFELSTMYIDGSMCRNIYECTGPESCAVNETKVDACKIYRTVIEECGLTHSCCTVLTLHGQLLKQEWKGCDYILQLNPLAWIDNAKPGGNIRLRLKHTWEKDVELYSKYLDEKTLRSMHVQSYLVDHPELTDMIKDYVQSVLLMKPKHILNFTINHFRQYLPYHMPRNEYFDPGAPQVEKGDDDHDKAI